MMPRLIRPACFTIAVVMVISAASAQKAEPFTGLVTGDEVNIRAGAGQNYYVVGTVEKGELLKVHEDVYGWYRIDPPAGSFSYISKAFVKIEGDGTRGTVTGNDVKVRAPSPAGPDNSYRTQLKLDEGDAVQIVGETDSHYKIVPPAGAHVFVHEEFVARATAEQIAAAKAKAAQAAAPAPSPSPAPAPAAEPEPATVAAAPAAELPVPMPAPATKPSGATVAQATEKAPKIEAPSVSLETPAPAPAPEAPATTLAPEKPVPAPAAPQAASPKMTAPAPAEQASDSTPAPAQNSADPVVTPAPQPAPEAKAAEPAAAPAQEPAEAQMENPAEPAAEVAPELSASDAPAPEAETTEAEAEPAEPVKSTTLLAQVEERYLKSVKLPLAEQPVADLRMEYEKLLAADDLSDSDRSLIKARIELLANRQELQNSIKQIQAVKQEMTAAAKERKEADARKPPTYIAVGRLTASSLYSGEKLPLLYRLVDPLSGLTIAYVQMNDDAKSSPNAMLNQYVGVVGERSYDPALKLNVIQAEQIDALAPAQNR